jgi:hypothetical protein
MKEPDMDKPKMKEVTEPLESDWEYGYFEGWNNALCLQAKYEGARQPRSLTTEDIERINNEPGVLICTPKPSSLGVERVEEIIKSHFSVMTFPDNDSADEELKKLATAIVTEIKRGEV